MSAFFIAKIAELSKLSTPHEVKIVRYDGSQKNILFISHCWFTRLLWSDPTGLKLRSLVFLVQQCYSRAEYFWIDVVCTPSKTIREKMDQIKNLPTVLSACYEVLCLAYDKKSYMESGWCRLESLWSLQKWKTRGETGSTAYILIWVMGAQGIQAFKEMPVGRYTFSFHEDHKLVSPMLTSITDRVYVGEDYDRLREVQVRWSRELDKKHYTKEEVADMRYIDLAFDEEKAKDSHNRSRILLGMEVHDLSSIPD